MKRFRASRRGYVLLTSLLIIAIAGVLVTGLVRHSLNLAASSIRADRELQSKWGAISCTRFANRNRSLLLRADRFVDGELTAVPTLSSDFSLNLGDQEFFILLQDESGKLNINHSYRTAGRESTRSAVRKFSGNRMPISLRPMRSQNLSVLDREFESWSQVFQAEISTASPDLSLIEATRKLTCWGQGINLNVVPDDVLTEVAKPLIGASMVNRLLKIRKEGQTDNWEEQLLAAGAREAKVAELAKFVRPSSTAHSVWVVNRSSHRSTVSFSVTESISSSMTRSSTF